MQQPDKVVLIDGVIIIFIGFLNAVVNNRPKTKVFAGGVGFILLMALLDAFGGDTAKLASALMTLATITVVMVETPALVQAVVAAQSASITLPTGVAVPVGSPVSPPVTPPSPRPKPQ